MTRYLLDANVLVALAWPNHVHHRRALTWFASISSWATTPVTESALLRLSMNSSVVGRSVTLAEAGAVLRAIRGANGHEFLVDEASLAIPVIDLTSVATSRQITDAHLVNLAAGSGCVLATLDRGIPHMLAPGDARHVVVLPD